MEFNRAERMLLELSELWSQGWHVRFDPTPGAPQDRARPITVTLVRVSKDETALEEVPTMVFDSQRILEELPPLIHQLYLIAFPHVSENIPL
jgi:hypothetical protein